MKTNRGSLLFRSTGLLVIGLVAWALSSEARGAAYSLTFYVPFPEADYLAGLQAIETGGSGDAPANPVQTFISIAAIADGTIIRYDHWEDGYDKFGDLEMPLQPTTEVWGDNNPANGMPPGFTNDLIKAGSVVLLGNQLTTTSPGTIDFDSRDKIIANRTISVTRTFWASGSGTLMAGCVEVFDLSFWGLEYRVPVGQNIPDATDAQMFEYSAMSVMAANSGTVVRVDRDANGIFESTNTLNEGETLYVGGGVNVGGTVLATKPVQVVMLSGDVASNYESRDSSLLPVSRWGSSYFTPVSTPAGDGTRIWLYNPSASTPITVYYDYRVGSGSVTRSNAVVVATNSVSAVLLPVNSGAHFYTTNTPERIFYAYSTTDSDSTTTTDNQAWDWSFTLFPRPLLSPQVVVGLGVGRDPDSGTNPSENGNPVWVTPVGNGETPITVYVDFDGDNQGPLVDPNGFRYDTNYPLRELQQQMVYDPDGDQTAMLLYVLSTNVSLAAAWGQDPATATAGAPGLDVGTSIPPQDVLDVEKTLAIPGDIDADGQLGPGDQAEYLILIANSARATIPAALMVQDALPPDTAYVSNSTAYRPTSTGAWFAVSDDLAGTPFPLDGTGRLFNVAVSISNHFSLRYRVNVAAYSNLTPGVTTIINTGSVRSVSYNRLLTFRNETDLHGSIGDRVWLDANGNGVQDASENGLNGVTVYLDDNTNGVFDAGEAGAVTAGDGNYLLVGPFLVAGAHVIRVDSATLPAWCAATYDLDGTGTLNRANVALAAGQDRADVDFGYRALPGLGDFVWEDSNANGQQDSGEPGLPNVVVRLYGTNNQVMAVTTSSVVGAYAFMGLPSGTFTVGFTPPAGYLFTTSNVGNDAGDSDPLTGTNRTASITLVSGQTNLTADAGFYRPASLSGSVRVDADGDGVIDPEDTLGIANVTIRLLDAALNVAATTATSGTGDYAFPNVTPGSYTIVQALPSGYSNTVDAAAPNDLRIPRTLTSGQDSTGNDFYDTIRLADLRNKVLYLSDPGQALDRIDPAAAGDNTTAQIGTLTYSAGGGYATIGVASVSTGVTTDVTSTTPITCVVRHTVPAAGTNRLLIVGVSENISAAGGTDGRITGVTYGSFSLVNLGAVTNQDAIVSMFALVSPPAGVTNVVVTFSSAPEQYSVVGAITFTNVNQTTPYGAFYSNVGNAGNPTLTLPSATNEMVVDTVSLQSSVLSGVGSGQTRRWVLQSPENGGTANGGGSTKTGATSTTVSWTSTSGANPWSLGAVSIKPALLAGTGNSITFTQAPAFASSFILPVGTLLQITNYIGLVSGSLPTNPAIVATLSYGGNPFLTVSNPVYRAASSSLVWRATVPATVTVPAGQAVALSLASAQTGATFNIYYDSAAFPSKIVMPTVTVIDVPGFGVYDAPYPGGSLAPTSTVLSLRYVRITVADPFGAYDITGAGLAIDGPGTAGDLNATLTDAHVVASNAASKTYEYPWQTTATLGAYTLTATAHEGSEGIVAIATTTETLVPQVTSVGDFVWVDSNGNGRQDGGEPGLSNVTVRLYDSNSIVVASTTSSVSGAYFFIGKPVGSYSIGFTPPAGYLFTTSNVGDDAGDSDALPGAGRTEAVALLGNQTNLTVDAGFFRPATLSGFVRVDLNGNGAVEAGDTNGLPGVTVQLLDASSNVVATTTTAADGSYGFTNLAPGVYTVLETDLAGWYSTTDVAAPNDNRIPVTLVSGQTSAGNVFHDTQRATVGNFTWIDANGNGQQDVGETGLANVVVRLYDTNDVVVSVATSAVSGAYAFTNLAAGVYRAGFAPPAGYLFTTSNVGGDAGDSDPLAGMNRTAAVTLLGGQTDTTIDAGFYPGASIFGFVREDMNGNGLVEAGDTNGVAGATVQLLDAFSNVVATTVTAADGSYAFANLHPGAYTVRETDLAGWYSTTDVAAPNDNRIPVTLAIGQNSTGNVFHDTQRATIGDFVWVDANANGQQDGGETGLSGVAARLYDVNNVVVATVTSAVSGAYVFTNLAPGAYSVGFTPPAGYLFTTSNVGSDAGDSDPLPGTNRTVAVTLVSGQGESTLDAGFYRLAALAGAVRVDVNGNGAIDAEDTQGIAGTTVQLFDGASNEVASVTTDSVGNYLFAEVTPGSYTVVQVLPSGYTNTLDAVGVNDLRIPRSLTSGQNSAGNDFYDTRAGSVSAQNKVLYLSDPGQSLDRIDPAATGDNTTTQSALFGSLERDNTTTAIGNAIVNTFSHITGRGENRLLLVGVSMRAGGGAVASVTYGGNGLTRVGAQSNGTSTRMEIWSLVNPPVGTNDVVVTLSASGRVVAGAVTFRGVDVANPLGSFASASGNSAAPAVNAGSSAGEVVFGTAASADGNTALSSGTGQDGLWDVDSIGNNTTDVRGGGAIKPGAATVALTWSAGNTQWAVGAVSIRPAGALVRQADFAQAPAFVLPFSLVAGAVIQITNYMDVTGGAMPSNPAITARLSAGGSTFLTLSNPTYSSGDGALVWSASLGSAVAIAAGQGISLAVSNAQSDVQFRIRYDSATSPSKVVLPTASIIAVPSLAIYDAAYPGGDAVATTPITAQRFVRVTVTDPFGAYDISGAGIVIDGPGAAGDASVSLTDAQVVAGNAWSKTYEYMWQTAAVPGSYSITVTANEGSEGITANATTTERLEGAVIGDFVWIDQNGNGTQDVAEVGLSNVIVRAYTGSVVIATTTSSVSGAYSLTNLPPGTYTVGFTPPAGYQFTTANVGSDAADSDPLPGTNRTATYTLTSGQTDNTIDAGFFILIAGTVFHDVDRLTDNTVDGVGTNAGVLRANLVNPLNHLVLASVAVNPDGTYRFTGADGVTPNTAFEIILTVASQTNGATLTNAVLPVKWVSTGEHLGAGPGSDGTVDGRLSVTTDVVVTGANFGIVKRPDITPIISAVPNIMHGVQRFYITVRVTELNLVDTEGLITVRVPKDVRWVFDGPYDPTLTKLGNTTLDNAQWSYSQNAVYHIFTSTTVIPHGSSSYFGFRAVWDAGQTRGIYTITSQIDSWSGNEDRIDNNVDSERLDYFIQ